MEFCVITPTSGLYHYALESKRHMVLTHQFMRDETYRNFYFDRREAGDFIILDNGVYEGEYREIDYHTVLRSLQPTVAVLPDIICKGVESVARSLKFYYRYARDYPKTRWMLIPHGRNEEELLQVVELMKAAFIDGELWVGLTRFLPTDTCPQKPFIRVEMAERFKAFWPNSPIHCMGMAAGSLDELKQLGEQGLVESIDSSAPAWRGWNGFALGDSSWDRQGCEVDFSAVRPRSKYFPIIKKNLEVVFDLCRSPRV